jgi:hypothetical protein
MAPRRSALLVVRTGALPYLTFTEPFLPRAGHGAGAVNLP